VPVLGFNLLQYVDAGTRRLAGDGNETEFLHRIVAYLIVQEGIRRYIDQALIRLRQELRDEVTDGVQS
jgi:hypothetical protein